MAKNTTWLDELPDAPEDGAKANWLDELPDAPEEGIKAKSWLDDLPDAEVSMGESFKRGVDNSLFGLATQALKGNKVEEYNPEGVGNNIAYYAGELIPDLIPLIATGGIGGIVAKGVLGEGAKQAGKFAFKETLKKGGVKGLTQELAKRAAPIAVSDATSFAALEAVKSPIRQKAQGKELSLGETIKDIGIGTAAGAIGGPLIRGASYPVGEGLGYVGGKIISKARDIIGHSKVPNGLELSEADKLSTDYVNQLVNEGKLVNAEDIESVKKRVFGEVLQEKGYNITAKSLKKPSRLGQIGTMEAQLEEAGSGDLVIKMYESKIADENAIAPLIKEAASIEELIAKNKISPKRLADLIETGADGASNEIELEAINRSDKLFLDIRKMIIDAGGKPGEREHFLPRRLMFQFETPKGIETPLKKEMVLPSERVRLREERTSQNKSDAIELMYQYLKEASSTSQVKQVLPEVHQRVLQLRMMGQDGKANLVEDWFKTSMGLDSKRSESFIKEHYKGTIEEITKSIVDEIESATDTEKLARDAFRYVNDAFHGSVIGLNAPLHFKQMMSNRLVLAAELGSKWVEKGHKAALRPTKEQKAIWDRNAFKTTQPELDVSEGIGSNALNRVTSGAKGKVLNALNAPGKWGNKLFSWTDRVYNRKGAFFAGYEKFMSEYGKNPTLLEHLPPSIKAWVENTARTQGKEAAAELFGRQSSHRSNLMYSLIDKPTMFREGMLRYVPFMTWGRNQYARLLQDIKYGDPEESAKRIAKKIAIPIAWMSMIKLATGYDVKGAHPMSGMNPFKGGSIAPAVTSPLESLMAGNFKKAAKQIIGGIPLFKTLLVGYKMYEKGPVEGLGFIKEKTFRK